MRNNLYITIEDVLKDSNIVSINHLGHKPSRWVINYENVIFGLKDFLPHLIIKMCDSMNLNLLYTVNNNPSEFIKLAHMLQLSNKFANNKISVIKDYYLYLNNCGILLRNYRCNKYMLKLNTIDFIRLKNKKLIRKISFLSALLRSFCESLYCDNHSAGCEIYNSIVIDGKNIILKEYNNIFPDKLYPLLDKYKLKIESIYIILSYEKVNCNLDYIGNYIDTSDLNKNIKEYSVMVKIKKDGWKKADEQFIDSLIEHFSVLLKEVIKYYRNMGYEEKIQHLIKTIVYPFNNILQILNYNWYDISIEAYESFKKYCHIDFVKIIGKSQKDSIDFMINPKKSLKENKYE